MKKIIAGTILLAALPLMTLAQTTTAKTAPTINVLVALDSITNWMFTLLLIVAAIFIIIAAYFFVVAQGDPEKTKTARNFVLWALIGVLVGFLAKGLIVLVGTILGQ